MPATWEFRDSVILVTAVGDWSGAGTASAVTEAMADPRFEPGTALVLDIRLSKTNPSADQVRARAEWVAALRASGLASRCAIVVGPKAHQFGLARMAQAHLESREMEVRIFRDLDKALTWVAPPRPE
jgi:hypothetical protein